MMDVEAVLEFLRENGFSEVELATRKDMDDKACEIGSVDLESFLFPMNRFLPPVRVPASSCRRRGVGTDYGGDLSEDDDFVSLVSSTSADAGCYSSEFTNPYGQHSNSEVHSDASSDRLSQFGTAREYHEFDMQIDLWHNDRDEGYYFSPISGLDPFGCESEDKFVTETHNNIETPSFGFEHISQGLQSQDNFSLVKDPLHGSQLAAEFESYGHLDYKHLDNTTINHGQDVKWDHTDHVGFSNPNPYKTFAEEEGQDTDSVDLKGAILTGLQPASESSTGGYDPASKEVVEHPSLFSNAKDSVITVTRPETANDVAEDIRIYNEDGDGREVVLGSQGTNASVDEQETVVSQELLILEDPEDEYDVFNLRIIHRKNRTGFEENKDFPIVLNTLVAGRYLITQYLGSATFSKVVQAYDIHTGVDVCLKIIKNNKDFFDQSLDEIKILKYVNKHDPYDKKHIIRLYDYFYHQEHLFIVCELLRANLYEFQKYNAESGGEPYFTMSRLQAIACQCLEALDFLHKLGIIHSDLKPENILIKSYSRCEIKVIDLGSSCFQMDNLCLYVQSRSYRAPEVILGLPYGPKIDIWSLGCILAELCSGEVLFPNDAIVLLLARMIGMFGPIDLEMLLEGKETHKYFTEEHDLFHINEDTDQVEYIVPEMSSIEQQVAVSDVDVIDFIKYLLQINPQVRPTAEEAMRHPWLSKEY